MLGVGTLVGKSKLGFNIKAQKKFNGKSKDTSSILKASDDGPGSRTTRILSSRDCNPMSNEYGMKSSRQSITGGGKIEKTSPIVQFAKVNYGRESESSINVGS